MSENKLGGLFMEELKIVWKDRKRPIFGLPLSFTKYMLLEDKILINTGLLSTKQEEIKLYRIMDVTLKRSLWQKIFGVGTIHCCSADKTTPEFDILDVKKSFEVKEMISKMSEEQRDKKRITGREILIDSDDDDLDDDIH